MKFSYTATAIMAATCLAGPSIKKDTLSLFELEVAQSNTELDGQLVKFDQRGRLLVGRGIIAEGFFEPDANGAIMSGNSIGRKIRKGRYLSTGKGGVLKWSTDIHDALEGFSVVQQMLDYSDNSQFTACPIGHDYFISLSTGCTDGVTVSLSIVNMVQ